MNTPNVIRSATQADRSPERMRASPITVANGRTIRLSSVGISNSGKAFGNSSSLDLRWELSNCDGLATWDDAYDIPTSKSGWERFLILQNASGLVRTGLCYLQIYGIIPFGQILFYFIWFSLCIFSLLGLKYLNLLDLITQRQYYGF